MSERDIFFGALEKATPEERAAYLDGACGPDLALRRRVEDLLKEHFSDDSLLREATHQGAPTRLDASPVLEGPGTQIGRYKLLQKLGEGGFGVVYMAEQKEPVKRRVALKIIKLGMDTQQVVARFEAERQALAMMDHPNIAKVHDAGATDTGRPYFVMELVKGMPITKYCDENELTTQERLELFIPICQAIQHAHQKGIIHRDIKPSNIMVTLHDGVPVPKVIDFGIAKATQQELTEKTIFTHYGQFIGTPAYMSPEQADMSGLDIDTRSDIYSLGVVLYELLVGRTPLDAKELLSGGFEEIRRRIKEQEPPKPSTRVSTLEGPELTAIAKQRKIHPGQLGNALRGDLDWVVMKALEKDRQRRYETANGFALDLKRYLANEPVTAVAPSAIYLARKYFRRHRVALTVAAIIGALLIVGTTVSTWEAIRAKHASAVAEAQRREAEVAREKAEKAQAAEKDARMRADEQKGRIEKLLGDVYAANMKVAQHAWDESNMTRVRQVLAETAGVPERGFEWDYWQRQLHLDLHTLRQLGTVTALAYSPEGRELATGGSEGLILIWNPATGELLRSFEARSAVSCLAWSLDGTRILSGSKSRVCLWDAQTGRELLRVSDQVPRVTAVAFSPGGERFATAAADAQEGRGERTAKVWEAKTGHLLVTLVGHQDGIFSIAFSPDGKRIVTGSRDRTTKLWNAADGSEQLTLKGHLKWINSVAFSPDGRCIATAGGDVNTRIWDAATGQAKQILHGHTVGEVESVAFSPDGSKLTTAGDDKTVRLWDATTGQELRVFRGHDEPVLAVAFSSDGRQLASAASGSYWMPTSGNAVKIWDLTSPAEFLDLKGHTGIVSTAMFSPDGRRVVTSSGDGHAKVWDAVNGRELRDFAHPTGVGCACFSPGGESIATGCGDGNARLWDANTGKLRLILPHGAGLWWVAFSPDGRRLLTVAPSDQRDARTPKIWDTATGELTLQLRGHTDVVWSGEFSSDGGRVVTASKDGTARVWDAASGDELVKLQGHQSIVVTAAFAHDGRRIVTGSSDYTARVWDAASGKELKVLTGHNDQLRSTTFSTDDRRILTASTDSTARIWDAVSYKELLVLKGQKAEVRAAFSPDARQIATASLDGTARIWTPATLEQVNAWQRQEQDEPTSRAGLSQRMQDRNLSRAARAGDPGAIKQWLVLGPIPLPARTEQKLGEDLGRDQVPDEARLQPHEGDHVSVQGQDLAWKAVRQDDYTLDFNQLFGKTTEWSAAYAVAYVHSDTDRTGLTLHVGDDDWAGVYLNGHPVFRQKDEPVWEGRSSSYYEDDHEIGSGINLRAGWNTLVFKVLNGGGGWQGSIRISDANDQPVPGLRVALSPENLPSDTGAARPSR